MAVRICAALDEESEYDDRADEHEELEDLTDKVKDRLDDLGC